MIPERFLYRAYGLVIASEILLPELAGGIGEADITIVREPLAATADDRAISEPGHRLDESTFLFWNPSGRYLVRDGQRIVVDPAPGVDEGVVRAQVLGIALPVLLHQRGALVLHASAVEMAGSVTGFLGASHAGKSTTAAIFHAHGYPLLSDDIIPVESVGDLPMVAPGFPYVKIWPDSVAALGHESVHLRRFVEAGEKRILRAGSLATAASMPLGRLFLLDRGRAPGVVPMTKQEALQELMAHTFVSSLLKTHSAAARHLAQCAALLRTVTVSRIGTRGQLDSLSSIVRMVEEEFGTDGTWKLDRTVSKEEFRI